MIKNICRIRPCDRLEMDVDGKVAVGLFSVVPYSIARSLLKWCMIVDK